MFDDPGRFDMHPKDIERTRRDSPNHGTVHEHIHFDDRAKIPSKWRDLLGCRRCKRALVEYVGDCLLRIAPRYLSEGQKLIVGGACDSTERDHTWSTTEDAVEHLEPCYFSNAEEATHVCGCTLNIPQERDNSSIPLIQMCTTSG